MQTEENIPEVTRTQIEHIAEVCKRIKPLVVIRCITYNHEAFLKDALEGFLMQKTDFPFVAVVHEDASTDGTAAVLRKYAEQYPDKILPIYEEENQYSKRDRSIGRIMNAASKATGAKYVAMCEGDDYWTYEYKLQKQVDFLESHPDYSLVFHNAMTLKQDGSFVQGFNIRNTGEYTASDIIRRYIPTASFLYKIAIAFDPILENKKFRMRDDILLLTAAMHGKLYGTIDYWSVYRRHPGGVTSAHGIIYWLENVVEHYKVVTTVFEQSLGKQTCVEILSKKYLLMLEACRNQKKYSKYFYYFVRGLKDCGFIIIKHEWTHFVEITGKYKKWPHE